MNTSTAENSTKEQILHAFQRLRSEHQQLTSAIKTKQDAAEREADKQIVETASTYTVDSIVKGLADLQLDFGKSMDSLVEKLAVEAPKLEELRRAIRVETQHLEELHNIRIAADALDILIQEHQEAMATLNRQSQQERQQLDLEIRDTRQAWQKAREEFEAALAERQERLQKERQQQEADYEYQVERTRKREADEYAAQKTALERQISEENAKREMDWAEREEVLAEQQDMRERYRTLAASYPQELQEATEKARQTAMDEAYEEAKVEAELFEKEHATSQQVYELQVASLKETINQQARQLEALAQQFQVALKQVQDLTVRAVTGKMEA